MYLSYQGRLPGRVIPKVLDSDRGAVIKFFKQRNYWFPKQIFSGRSLPQKAPARNSSTGFANNLATLTVHELRKTELAYNLRDTNHFLQKVENINNSGILQNYDKIFMVSFDIASMFPSITKSHGLSACREYLDKRINPLFSTQCIIEATYITLEHNITSFNGEFFHQIKGTAMGAKNACDYADISMPKLDQYIHEEDLLFKHSFKPPIMFERFRDSIFAIFTDKESINRCFNRINSFYDSIKFTMSQPSNLAIEFLDTFVCFQDYKLST